MLKGQAPSFNLLDASIPIQVLGPLLRTPPLLCRYGLVRVLHNILSVAILYKHKYLFVGGGGFPLNLL